MPFVSVPNSGQTLGQTRDQIRNNILDLKNSLAVNHVDLDQGAQTGKHKFVEMPQQGSAPTTIAGEAALYTKSGSLGTQLYYIRDSVGATETQLSSSFTPTINATDGFTWLPGPAATGGILLQWGQKNIPNGAAQTGTITFPQPFRVATFPFSITFGYTVTGSSTAHNVWVDNPSNTTNASFDYRIDIAGLTVNIYWMAIGLAPT